MFSLKYFIFDFSIPATLFIERECVQLNWKGHVT